MGTGRTEFELKFTGSPGDVAKLPNSDFIGAIAPHGAWEKLVSTYYDTPDEAFTGKGLSLRLREEGASLVQAVKAKGANAVSRVEYERELDTEADFPKKCGDQEIDALIRLYKKSLRPIARISVERWSAIISFKGSRIELAVDVGTAESWGRDGSKNLCPLAEVELELIEGEPKTVFALARLLIGNAPLRLSTGTKLATALALRTPPDNLPSNSKVTVTAETKASAALRQTLDATAARLSALQRHLVEFRAPEAIHQMRVALRRLRSIERVYRPFLKTDEIADLAAQAKTYADVLGAARDWDVLLGETIPATQTSDYAPSGLRLLKANAEVKRAEAWAEVIEAIDHEHFTRFLLSIVEASVIAKWSLKARPSLQLPVIEFAPPILDKALKRTKKLSKTLDGVQELSARHPMRIALKKFRYPVQLFRSAYPKSKRKDYMGALSMLQEAFGRINDAVVAQSLVDIAAKDAGPEAIRAAGFIAGFKAAEAQAAAEQIDQAWAVFAVQRPFWQE
ncbi:CHAD domain-containing protein [Hyphococcus sp. DH-69]|uniref:CYTH and CHAD domain-containing protein n=1 Tax=Hyphococcus formosus TaxID=3143534 RepID=UPI00398A5610